MTARATPPYVREQDITQHVGSAAAQRARPYSRDGSISGLTWDEDEGDEDAAGTLSGTVHGTSTVPYRTRITLRSADPVGAGPEIGRASCRERGWMGGGAVAWKRGKRRGGVDER